MTLIPLERKQLVLKDAIDRILKNHTLKQIAKSHGITKHTLNTWLMLLGEEYQELRRVWVDNILTEALEEKDNATENFPPRANSKRKAATWYAERKDQQRYGGHRVNINTGNSVSTYRRLILENEPPIFRCSLKMEPIGARERITWLCLLRFFNQLPRDCKLLRLCSEYNRVF